MANPIVERNNELLNSVCSGDVNKAITAIRSYGYDINGYNYYGPAGLTLLDAYVNKFCDGKVSTLDINILIELRNRWADFYQSFDFKLSPILRLLYEQNSPGASRSRRIEAFGIMIQTLGKDFLLMILLYVIFF